MTAVMPLLPFDQRIRVEQRKLTMATVPNPPSYLHEALASRRQYASLLSGRMIALIIAQALFVIAFCVWYVGHEQPLYYWDWGGYFDMYIDFFSPTHSMSDRMAELARSIANDDYNISSIAALYPFHAAFGDSRLGYVLGVALVYMIPSQVLCFLLSMRVIRSEADSKQSDGIEFSIVATGFFFCMLMPAFWSPVLRGLPDIVGLVPLLVAILLFLSRRPLERHPLAAGAGNGVLLWMTYLFRRWYAFTTVSVGLLMMVFSLWDLAVRRDRPRLKAVLAVALSGLVVVACLFLFQRPLVLQVLATDYTAIYSAYNAPAAEHLRLIWAIFGIPFLGLIFIGLVSAIRHRNRAGVFCFLAGALTYALFTHVQVAGVQHRLPVIALMVPLALNGMAAILRSLPVRFRPVMAGAAILYCFGNFAVVHLPAASERLGPVADLFSTLRYPPLRIDNFDNYVDLTKALEAETNNRDQFAVFAGGGSLSDSMLFAIDRSLRTHVADVAQVDARDGFKLGALNAPIAVIGTPTPIHLEPKDQQVILVIANEIRSGTGAGAAYEPVGPTYQLDGTVAQVYRRTRPVTDEDVAHLVAVFQTHYPSWKREADGRIR